MSGHLCLKWNNHSSAFLKSIGNIHTKEKYCDATIVCQGKYFPVHRVVLSTCSDYFDEMFERMQCQHPYIVFKDIEPREMELLLNYMYQGEVNVVQENLPTLIKAAEALKIKGLAVPDDLPTSKESSGRKRGNTSNDTPLSKRRAEERRKRRDSSQGSPTESESYSQISSDKSNLLSESIEIENKCIKEEPLDTNDYIDSNIPASSLSSVSNESQSRNKEENLGLFGEFPVTNIKTEEGVSQDESGLYEGQSSAWSEYSNSNMEDLPPPDMGSQDDDDSDSFWSSDDLPHSTSSSSIKSRPSNSLKKFSKIKNISEIASDSRQRRSQVSQVCRVESCRVEIFAACPSCCNMLCYNHFTLSPCVCCKADILKITEEPESPRSLLQKYRTFSADWKNVIANGKRADFSFANTSVKISPIQRTLGATCGNTCRRDCKSITEEERRYLLETYWNLADCTEQRSYLTRHIITCGIKHRTIKGERRSRRGRTLKYYFTLNSNYRIEVCKVFFLGTLGITERQVRTALGKLEMYNQVNLGHQDLYANEGKINPDHQ